MPIHYRSLLTLKYKDLIGEKFSFLVDFFNFEPGHLFIEVLPLDEFKNYCGLEGVNLSSWGVGVAVSNGRIFVLDKKDFPKKEHKKEEFERVILHELAHMFIRRILWPKQTSPWIEEGICEFISFGDYPLKIKEIIDFETLKTLKGWRKHYAYQQSKEFFKRLSKEFGNKKIVEFIKKMREKSEEESFKEVFGEELNETQQKFKAFLENEKITSSRNTL